ncbi:MAG TPA: isochorismatase family protein, partial [Tahibacter sp.]|nr:isochorismatase family protein [Tahibacter sp.]
MGTDGVGDRVAIGVGAGVALFHFNLLKSKKTASAAGTQGQAGSVPRKVMPVAPERTPLAGRRAARATALVVIDMFSAWDFPDADALGRAAIRAAGCIAALKRRCDGAGVPTVFVNDNRGRWRSDAPGIVAESAVASRTGAAIAERLRPGEQDYFVLKPKHSAFFATPLDLLLRHLRVRRLIVSGVAADQCVLLAAIEARMQD